MSKAIRPGDPAPTTEQEERIVKWLSQGAILETALARAGVPRTLFHRWLRAAAENLEPYATFAARVEAAKTLFECKLLASIASAADKGSLSAAQFLFTLKYGAKYKREADREAGIEANTPMAPQPQKEVSEEEIEAAEQRALAAQQYADQTKPRALTFGLDAPKKVH